MSLQPLWSHNKIIMMFVAQIPFFLCPDNKIINNNNKWHSRTSRVVMDWADTAAYLGAMMQSYLKFDQHMALKKDKALKTLGAITHILKQAPQEGVTGLHQLVSPNTLEYADTV